MKHVLRAAIFAAVTIFLSVCYHNVFSFKYGDGIYGLTVYYEQPEDTVDVLVLGSSHAFENVNTAVMWDEYGLAAFDLTGSVQPLWNTYFYLKEALKTQTPKLVILEAYGISLRAQYSDASRIIKNVAGMRWSLDKLEALLASAPKEDLLGYGLEHIQYHNRYSEIGLADFLPYQGDERYFKDWKGFGDNYAVQKANRPAFEYTDHSTLIEAKAEFYYRKIISLCEEKQIPLLIIAAPYFGYTAGARALYNSAKSIAQESGVPFIDYNEKYDEIGLDFSLDFADSQHLNASGNRKFTRVLCKYIDDSYEIDDRRQDQSGRYDSWRRMSEYLEYDALDRELRSISDLNLYLARLASLPDGYRLLIKTNGFLRESAELTAFTTMYGIDLTKDNGRLLWVAHPQGTYEQRSEIVGGVLFQEMYGSEQITVDPVGVYQDRKKLDVTAPGIFIAVLNEHNQCLADCVTITSGGLKR